MAIGPFVRSWFGPLERPVTDLYRAAFFNLSPFVAAVHRTVPDAARILEVGCGEGAMCLRLAKVYPRARLVGIDITPRVGRQFCGDRSRVTFQRATAAELAADRPGAFDLVVFADVLHHVPPGQRADLLRHAGAALAPGGWLVVKDWERRGNPAHAACYFADVYIANDPGVRYGTAAEFRALFRGVFGPVAVREQRFGPWPNNMAFFFRPGVG
jgi:2-polyprenyl-6-hydroxyphenyl methylase/3-demethylubiquinone-9 3-methyltransferase